MPWAWRRGSASPPSPSAGCSSTWPGWRTTGFPFAFTGETRLQSGERLTGRPTPTGNGTRQPRTRLKRCAPFGRKPCSTPARWWRRRWQMGDWISSPNARGSDGRAPSLRWILVHMIEEYARHNGHADFIRESIDGAGRGIDRPLERSEARGEEVDDKYDPPGRVAQPSGGWIAHISTSTRRPSRRAVPTAVRTGHGSGITSA